MNVFVYNIILALAWAAMNGDFTTTSLVIGFMIGFFALWLSRSVLGVDRFYFIRVFRVLRLAFYFAWELTLSSIRVARDVLRPSPELNPRIVELPLDVKSDMEILLVTNLITLTPGTLSLDVTPDRKTLYVHALFADDPEAEVAGLKAGMERMVLEAFHE